jgi:hypothetical protein
MKIKQYRNLFENWQRHLVEGEVATAAGELAAVSQEMTGEDTVVVDIEDAKELASVSEEDGEPTEEDERVVKAMLDLTHTTFDKKPCPTDQQQNERRNLLYRIIQEELGLIKESDRGGMEAQVATAKWLNSVLSGQTAVVNKKGSTTPDVVVIENVDFPVKVEVVENKKAYKGNCPSFDAYKSGGYELAGPGNRTIQAPPYAPVEYDQNKKVSALEVKSAKQGKDGKMQTTFFDQTLSDASKAGEDKYFDAILRKMYTGDKLSQFYIYKDNVFRKLTEDDLEGNLAHLLLTQIGLDKEGGKMCGEYGRLTAPVVDVGYYDSAQISTWKAPADAVNKFRKNWPSEISTSARPVAFFDDCDNPVGLQDKRGVTNIFFEVDAAGEKKGRVKPSSVKGEFKLFFYNDTSDTYSSGTAIDVTKDIKPKLDANKIKHLEGKKYFMLVGSTRAASTSGKFNKKCFRHTAALATDDQQNQDVVIDEAVKQIEKHWNPEKGGDNYFVVANKSDGYKTLYVYATKDNVDPLELGVPYFGDQRGNMQNIGFDSYGLPTRDKQVRMKIYSDMKHVKIGDKDPMKEVPE